MEEVVICPICKGSRVFESPLSKVRGDMLVKKCNPCRGSGKMSLLQRQQMKRNGISNYVDYVNFNDDVAKQMGWK